MAGEQQPDVLGLVVERPGPAGEQVQRAEVVTLDVQLDRQHPGGAGLMGPGGELRPALLAGHVRNPDGLLLVHRVQARPLLHLLLEGVDHPRQLARRRLRRHLLPAQHHADRPLVAAGDQLDGRPHDRHQRRVRVGLLLHGACEVAEQRRQPVPPVRPTRVMRRRLTRPSALHVHIAPSQSQSCSRRARCRRSGHDGACSHHQHAVPLLRLRQVVHGQARIAVVRPWSKQGGRYR